MGCAIASFLTNSVGFGYNMYMSEIQEDLEEANNVSILEI